MKKNIDINEELLMDKAGERAFTQGLDCFLAGKVIDFKRKGYQVLGEVGEEEVYRVTIRHTTAVLDGYCDCPESENIFFCKHCVALAFAYREAVSDLEHDIEKTEVSDLKQYLNGLEKEELIGYFSDIVCGNSALRSEWTSRARCASGIIDVDNLKDQITLAMPFRENLHQYTQVRNYFHAVEPLIDKLGEHLPKIPADKALMLIDYAITRLSRVMESMDDSGGFRIPTEDALKKYHNACVARLDWPAEKIVNYLSNLFFSDINDFYPSIPGDYFDKFGDDVKSSFYKSMQEKWEQLPTLKEGASWEERLPYYRLQDILANEARAKGEKNTLIRIFRKTACDENDYIRMCELCLELGEVQQAEFWLKKIHRSESLFRRDTILRVEVKYYQAIENYARALECQWQLFIHHLTIEDYTTLIAVAEKAGLVREYKEKATAYLNEKQSLKNNQAFVSRYTNALVEIHIHEGREEEILPVIEHYQISVELLLKTARKNTWRPMVALRLYFRIANFYLANKSLQYYKMAVDILSECSACLETDGHRQVFQENLQVMRQTHESKTSFISLLDELACDCVE